MGSEPEWYSFGRCQHGELGRRVVTEGVEVPGLENADVRPLEVSGLSELACGHFHNLARAPTGEIFVWGANGESQLGLGADNADDAFVAAPCKADALQSLQESGESVSHFAAGRSHSVFVTSPGGRCFISGRLPTAEPSSSSSRRSEVREIQLTDASAQPQGQIVSCAAGETTTFFLSTEGEVKSKLEGIFLQQLQKQGEEDVTEVDITLTFNDRVLQDEETLQGAGVTENATITALSRKLAEVHGHHSGVFSVRKAFEELAELGESTAEKELQALNQAPPFSLFCNIQELGELGAGWVLFFHFVQFLGFLCIFLFVLQLPSYFVFRAATPEDLASWRNHTGTKRDQPISFDWITAGNVGPHGASSSWPWLCSLATAVVMLLLLPQYSRLQHWTKQHVDRQHVHPDDFALFIEGLPEDARDEEEIKQFIEAHGREGEETDVVMVAIAYDVAKFQSMLADIREAKEELREAPTMEKAVFEARLRERRAPFRSSDALREALPCTGQAVVVLRSQSEHREVLEEWDTFYEWLMTSLQCLKINSRQPRFRGRHVVRITRAANPSDILWENLGTSHRSRLYLRAKTYGIVALILLACLSLVVALNWALDGALGRKNTRVSGALATLSSLLVALVVMGTRIWASRTIRKQVMQQMHETKTTRDVSLLTKLALFYLTAYCVIAILVNWDPMQGEWYTVGGLVSDISSLMLINCITIPVSIILGCNLFIRRILRDSRLDLADPPPGLTQKRYQSFFELPDMDQTRPFAKILLTFSLGFIFMPIWPYAILIAAVALFLEYWAFKYQLLRQSKRPYRQGHEVSYAALRLLYVGTAGYALAQELFLKPSLAEAEASWAGFISLPLFVAPLLLMALSTRVQRLLCGGFLLVGQEAPTSSEVDYYVAQRAWPKHQKYHTTSMVYLLGFEVMDARARKLKWDPRTGNVKDPLSVPPPPTVSGPVASIVGSLTEHADEASMDVADRTAKDEEDDSDEDVEETEAIATEDPAALAMEEMKHKVPLSMLDAEADTEDDSEDVSTDDSDEDPGPRRPLVLAPGHTARLTALRKAGAEKFNGLTVTLLHSEGPKWVVQLPGGQKASIPPVNLQLKVKIVGLRSGQGKLYNGTVATLIEWNHAATKWLVELFTGIQALIPAENLEPVEAISDS
ncbi:HERC4 [Symbiodinium natans]|uniref:HERC4 protein n=1 Tax=Symbiodinium natans TaxID=878477 RepID=A0A812LVM6_9DINO|nr:HERC4 [Symbiodinium natans]